MAISRLVEIFEVYIASMTQLLYSSQLQCVVMAAGVQQLDQRGILHKYIDHIYKTLYRLKMMKVPTISLLDGLTGKLLV